MKITVAMVTSMATLQILLDNSTIQERLAIMNGSISYCSAKTEALHIKQIALECLIVYADVAGN